jgi:hypothetical protein
MQYKVFSAILCTLLMLGAGGVYAAGGPAAGTAAQRKPAIVGAIRWDGWFNGNSWERFLGPAEWHYRVPFYGKIISDHEVQVCSDSQQVMDKELFYANRAGLNYWAFCYYHPKGWNGSDSYNYGWHRFLASRHKGTMSFCFILQGSWLGPKEEWSRTVGEFVKLFKKTTYQKVIGNRPLLFVFDCSSIEPHFGSVADGRKAFDELREQTIKAGLGSPYIAAQVFSAADGAAYVDKYDFDAISAYSLPGGGGDHNEYPYSNLVSANVNFRNSCKAIGKKVIPIVNAGWDGRPRIVDPSLARNYQGSWHTMPKPTELAQNLNGALAWVRANPEAADSNAILIYAWNETDEGGWLVPTLSEGAARLDALEKVLKPAQDGGRQ